MKKYLSAVLALALMATLTVPAFAAEVSTGNQDVEADYIAPENIEDAPVYRATIEWAPAAGNDLSYTDAKTTYTWDTNNLQYTSSTETKGWNDGTAAYTVTVTNYSNAAVDVALTATAQYDLTVETSEDDAELPSAAVTEEGESIVFTNTDATGTAQPKDFTVTYSAGDDATAPNVGETGKITVGRITVTVNTKG